MKVIRKSAGGHVEKDQANATTNAVLLEESNLIIDRGPKLWSDLCEAIHASAESSNSRTKISVLSLSAQGNKIMLGTEEEARIEAEYNTGIRRVIFTGRSMTADSFVEMHVFGGEVVFRRIHPNYPVWETIGIQEIAEWAIKPLLK